MITMKSLLKDIDDKNEIISKLSAQIVKEKQEHEMHEAELWVQTPFKEKGLTNDIMRKSYVKQQLGLLYPSFYLQKQTELDKLKMELKLAYKTIDVMLALGVNEIELEEKED